MVGSMGSGEFTYETEEDWGKLPEGWSYKQVGAVAVDSRDRVYVYNWGEHPVIIFDREGNFLESWGEGVFSMHTSDAAGPHAATMGPDDTIYLVDDGDHTMRKCTLDGKVLMTLGVSGQPTPFHGGLPFNRCTDIALSPITNEIYISDGYGNARVHKFSPDGKLLLSWGERGTDPGQFSNPHNMAIDKDGYVYVADRENHRVQVFDANGRFETQWTNMARPWCIHIDRRQPQISYIGETEAPISGKDGGPPLTPRLSIYSTEEGKATLLARIGDIGPGEGPGQFTVSPHGIGVDSRGDLYVGEVSWTMSGRNLDPPREVRSLRKLRKRTE
jgi:hypothetical protein